MKKYSLFLFFFLFLSVGESFAGYVAIIKDKANIRSGPGKKYDIVITLDNAKYYPLQILKRQNKWLKVKDYDGDTGWIAEFLTGKIKVGIVKTKANVRNKPGKQGKKLWQAQKGETFKIIQEKNGWAEVIDIMGNKGWIYKSLLWGF